MKLEVPAAIPGGDDLDVLLRPLGGSGCCEAGAVGSPLVCAHDDWRRRIRASSVCDCFGSRIARSLTARC